MTEKKRSVSPRAGVEADKLARMLRPGGNVWDPGSMRSSLWQLGYAAGCLAVYRSVVKYPEATAAHAKEVVAQMVARAEESARAMAERDEAEDPAVKAARTQHLKRLQRDEAQASEFAALIRAGDTTKTARAKMGVGAVRAKRLRAIAVKMKWVRPRQKKAGPVL